MSDKAAKKVAQSIRAQFWKDFESVLSPKRASKQAYLEELEELSADLEGRIDCVREEIAAEKEEET